MSFGSFRACGGVTKPENRQKQSKNSKFGLKSLSQRVYNEGIYSGVGSGLNGTKVNALAMLFGLFRDSGVSQS